MVNYFYGAIYVENKRSKLVGAESKTKRLLQERDRILNYLF